MCSEKLVLINIPSSPPYMATLPYEAAEVRSRVLVIRNINFENWKNVNNEEVSRVTLQAYFKSFNVCTIIS